jgi:hypothetical protein
MQISGVKKYRRALYLTSDRIKELNSTLLNFCERVEFSATTKNGRDIQFADINEMLLYDNFRERHLTEVSIKGYTGYSSAFSIDIHDAQGMVLHYYSTMQCSYHFENFDIETLFLKRLNDILKKSTSSFWVLAKISLYGFLMLGCIVSSAVSYITGNVSKVTPLVFVVALLFSGALVVLCWLLDRKVYYNIFPAVAFLWGEEITRYEKWKNLRSNLFWVVIIGGIMGLFIAWLGNMILA